MCLLPNLPDNVRHVAVWTRARRAIYIALFFISSFGQFAVEPENLQHCDGTMRVQNLLIGVHRQRLHYECNKSRTGLDRNGEAPYTQGNRLAVIRHQARHPIHRQGHR